MRIGHRETTCYEVWKHDGLAYLVEFRCPQCQGPILCAETDAIEDGFEVICDNCGNVIRCYFRLVMDWD